MGGWAMGRGWRGRRRLLREGEAAPCYVSSGVVGLVGRGAKQRGGQICLASRRCAAMAAGVFARCVCVGVGWLLTNLRLLCAADPVAV